MGPSAPWSEVVAAAEDPGRQESIGESVVASFRFLDAASGRLGVVAGDARRTSALLPDDLVEVRRPVSYKGMRNFIGKMSLPSVSKPEHAGWFESRNEQENYRLVLVAHPVTQMVTQPLRLEWSFPSGVRSHVPDALFVTEDGRVTLLDVTRARRLDSAEARAIFVLTRATAAAMGWRYEVRGQLSGQHQRNVSFIWACRRAPADRADRWAEQARALPARCTVHAAARLLGGARPDYGAVWHLVATRRLFLDLASPVAVDTTVYRRPVPAGRTPCLIST